MSRSLADVITSQTASGELRKFKGQTPLSDADYRTDKSPTGRRRTAGHDEEKKNYLRNLHAARLYWLINTKGATASKQIPSWESARRKKQTIRKIQTGIYLPLKDHPPLRYRAVYVNMFFSTVDGEFSLLRSGDDLKEMLQTAGDSCVKPNAQILST